MAEDHTNENNIIEETINEEELSEQRRIRQGKAGCPSGRRAGSLSRQPV